MNEKIEKYSELLELTLEIQAAVQENDVQLIQDILKKRGVLISEIVSTPPDFTSEEKEKIDKIINKVKSLETEYTQIMIEKKDELAKDRASSVKNSRMINAYKIKRESKARVLDERN